MLIPSAAAGSRVWRSARFNAIRVSIVRSVTLTPILGSLVIFGGCATGGMSDQVYLRTDPGALPPANMTLSIPGLGPCTENPDRSLHLNASKAVHVLVHGAFGSSGQFRGMAQVLASHGQQTACFTYDDRAELRRSAGDLRRAVDRLVEQTQVPQVTVIGYSQGALVARNSFTESQRMPLRREIDLRLVTVSGPFNGIAAARTCGRTWLYPLTLGLLPVACHAATGAKWADITFSSRFIREPGTLGSDVSSYLKIDTDERGACRREETGRCVHGDKVFSLAEQRNPLVEADPRVTRVEIRAGHVEIVGNRHRAPDKLIAALQEQGVVPLRLELANNRRTE